MEKIYITGHRNPDVDSTCASYCYALLKSRLNKDTKYEPIRCGSLNPQTKMVFRKAGLEPPRLKTSLAPLVRDVVTPSPVQLSPEAPIYHVINLFLEETISMVPVFGTQGEFQGAISINEINRFFLSEQRETRPVYTFSAANISQVLPGEWIQGADASAFTAPLMTGVMADEDFTEHIEKLNLPPLLVLGNRPEIVKYAALKKFPGLVLTGIRDRETAIKAIEGFDGPVFSSSLDTAETLRLLRLSAPVKEIMNTDIPALEGSISFEEAREKLMQSNLRGLPVFENETFLGIVTRRSFVKIPRKKLIMVDHNEPHQSVDGAEKAEIMEIVDHHRFGAVTTNTPIHIFCKPLGSSSTLVYQLFRNTGQPVSAQIALLLTAGILSDTVNLQSPTTTIEDEAALRELSSLAGVQPNAFAEELFAQLKEVTTRDPLDVVKADFKIYESSGTPFGIGQVEVVTLEGLDQSIPQFQTALKDVAKKEGLTWTMLLITNVLKQKSLLVTTDFKEGEQHFIYQQISPGLFDLPGILSRKKQLLPEIFRVLEVLAQKK